MGKIHWRELPSGEQSWSSDRGELRVKLIDHGIILEQFTGYFEIGLLPHVKAPLERAVGAGIKPTVFQDWWGMTGYDSEARIGMTQWTFDIRPNLSAVHILLRSKIVAMGVSVANLTLGGYLRVHDSRTSFEASLQKALRAGG